MKTPHDEETWLLRRIWYMVSTMTKRNAVASKSAGACTGSTECRNINGERRTIPQLVSTLSRQNQCDLNLLHPLQHPLDRSTSPRACVPACLPALRPSLFRTSSSCLVSLPEAVCRCSTLWSVYYVHRLRIQVATSSFLFLLFYLRHFFFSSLSISFVLSLVLSLFYFCREHAVSFDRHDGPRHT